MVALPDGGDGATDFAALPCALGLELLELDREGIDVALQALQVRAKFGGGLVAQIAILLERLADNFFELRRNVGIQNRRGDGIAIQNSIKNDGGRASAE